MDPKTTSINLVIARQEYECVECRCTINPGDKMKNNLGQGYHWEQRCESCALKGGDNAGTDN